MATLSIDIPDELLAQLDPVRDRLPELLALSLQQPAVPARTYRAILDFLASKPTSDAILAFRPDPEMQARLTTLLARSRAGQLTPAEQAELDEFERIEHLADVAFFPHEVDHVVALKHGGQTDTANLAFACWRCNRHKGTDLGSFDPLTAKFSFLFNPRMQVCDEHFSLRGVELIGITPEGRTTS